MALSWHIVLLVYAVNFFCMGIILLAQKMDVRIPPRHSIIPGTNQKILYIQDYHAMTWGDGLAVPLVLNAFAHMAINGMVTVLQWIALLFLSNALSIFFLYGVCLSETHRPDYGTYDIGKQSWPGLIHAEYFGVCVSISIMAIWNALNGNITGNVLYLALLGGVVYSASFFADIKAGNLTPYKKI